jgi:hypothetical protein
MMTMQEIRELNLVEARRLGYPENINLPVFDETGKTRTQSEITDRLLCLYACVACSYGFPKERASKWLDREGLIDSLADSERQFFKSEIDSRQKATVQWQIEALWALAWCVKCHESLDFGDSCADDFIQLLPDIAKDDSTESFRTGRTRRAIEDIIAKADLSYCLHWAVRDAEIKGQPIPGKVPGNVVIERRKALEWVVGDVAWDDVSLDT